jgi:hypothetical protein
MNFVDNTTDSLTEGTTLASEQAIAPMKIIGSTKRPRDFAQSAARSSYGKYFFKRVRLTTTGLIESLRVTFTFYPNGFS